jgi:hypothetical protein
MHVRMTAMHGRGEQQFYAGRMTCKVANHRPSTAGRGRMYNGDRLCASHAPACIRTWARRWKAPTALILPGVHSAVDGTTPACLVASPIIKATTPSFAYALTLAHRSHTPLSSEAAGWGRNRLVCSAKVATNNTRCCQLVTCACVPTHAACARCRSRVAGAHTSHQMHTTAHHTHSAERDTAASERVQMRTGELVSQHTMTSVHAPDGVCCLIAVPLLDHTGPACMAPCMPVHAPS